MDGPAVGGSRFPPEETRSRQTLRSWPRRRQSPSPPQPPQVLLLPLEDGLGPAREEDGPEGHSTSDEGSEVASSPREEQP